MHVQNKHFSYCNFKASCAQSNLEGVAASSTSMMWYTLWLWLIFEAGQYLFPGPTVCLSFDGVCQSGAFLVTQYISFSVIESVIAKGLIDKIVVGKCCFNLAFSNFDPGCCSKNFCYRTSKLSWASCTSSASGQDSSTFSVGLFQGEELKWLI